MSGAFADYRAAVMSIAPDAASQGPALEIKAGDSDRNTIGPFGDFRSEEFTRETGGVTWTETPVVLIRKGWVLEIRGTFRGRPNDLVVGEDAGPDELDKAMGGRLVLIRAMLQSCSTLGQEGLSAPAPAR